jgi:hypothetical protein
VIKEKLKQKSFFYFIYLYYYLIFRVKFFLRRKTYSQFGEDLVIDNFFKNITGKYVDIGCYHPIKYNNTCLLYNRGWKGANIDLNPTGIDLFRIVRKNDLNIVACIAEDEGEEVEVYFDSNFSALNSVLRNNVDKFNIKNFKVYKTKTKKLSNLINFNFDFLNIDCEGMDYNILKSIDLKKYTPKLICIEVDSDKNKKLIYNYLASNFYELMDVKGMSYIFKKITDTQKNL